MSAPFPEAPQMGVPSQVQLIPERDEFVPPWPVPQDLSLVVTQNGVLIGKGFTVGDVLPERRWAIQADGEVMPRLEFEQKYLQKLEDWYRYASPEARQGAGGVPKSFKAINEPVPTVVNYVAVRVDPRDERRTLPMHYDPEATRGTRPNRLWDSANERFLEGQERLRALTRQYHQDPSLLKDYEVAEVEASLGRAPTPPPSPEEGLRQAARLLKDMRDDGVISREEFAQRMEKLVDGAADEPVKAAEPVQAEEKPKPKPKPKPKRKAPVSTAPCGEQVPNLQKRKHIEACPACQEKAA